MIILALQQLQLDVYLGVTTVEQMQRQPVFLDLQITSPTLPKACFTDDLADTICYQSIAEQLQDFCQDKKFSLLENLCYQVFVFIKKLLATSSLADSKITLTVKKIPPLENLQNSSFTIRES